MTASNSTPAPLVSVIVPVYNAGPYLRQTLDCICGQTLRDIEIILVDDGSTDDSVHIQQEYASRDSRITLLQQNKRYAGIARQRGMETAKGKYLAFLDSDDFFEPDMLLDMTNMAEANNSDIVVCGSDMYFEDDGIFRPCPHNLRLEYLGNNNSENFCPKTLFPEKIYHFVNPAPWAKLYKKSFVVHHQLRWAAHQHTNDILFVCSALALAEIVSVVNKVFVHYRVRSNSISHNKNKSLTGHYTAFRELKANLIRLNVSKKILHSFNERLLTGVVWNLSTLAPERSRELIKLIISEYEPEFQLLKEPISNYEEKAAYVRYKSLINPLTTVVLHEEYLSVEQAENILVLLLSITNADFDIVCLSHSEHSHVSQIFQTYADKNVHCTHLINKSKKSCLNYGDYCRGKYIIPFSNENLMPYQITSILQIMGQLCYLPSGVYCFELLWVLCGNAVKMEKQALLNLCMPGLRRRYYLLKIKTIFSFGKRRRKYRAKALAINHIIKEYHCNLKSLRKQVMQDII